MAINFQYNKTALQQLDKQLKIRQRALPTIKSKEAALRVEVKKAKDEFQRLKSELNQKIEAYEHMKALWAEFDSELIRIDDVELGIKKIAGVEIPVLKDIEFEVSDFSLFNQPKWFLDGVNIIKELAAVGIEQEVFHKRMELLDHARKKTTQKVNLFEKVQIPGYEDAIRKIKRFLEDKENLSKAAQKIVKNRQQQNEMQV
jgi:V/A-type H+-transporting ATPase subunit D